MKNRKITHLLLIVCVGLIAYSNIFDVPFVFDDLNPETGIAGNPVVKSLDNFISSSKAFDYNPRRFVGYLTFALNYHFGGLDVTGYHAVNFAVHISNAALVYFLMLLTFRTPYFQGSGIRDRGTGDGNQVSDGSPVCNHTKNPFTPPLQTGGGEGFVTHHSSLITAFLVALLFVSHPVQTQAVTYVVQRFTSLATMFYLLSLVMYIKARLEVGGWRLEASILKPLTYFVLSFLFAVLAMMTKEIAFTLPIMIIMYEFFFFRWDLRKKLLFLLPLLLTLIVIPAGLLNFDRPLVEILSELGERTRVQTGIPRWDYLMTEMRVIVTYIRLLFVPVNQNLYYDYPIYRSFFEPDVFISSVFLLSLLGTAIYLVYKTRAISGKQSATGSQQSEENSTFNIQHSTFSFQFLRFISFGIFWFFIALSVESSVIPIEDVIFEHRLYLPSIGAFVAMVAAIFTLANRFAMYSKHSAKGIEQSTAAYRKTVVIRRFAPATMLYALCAMLIVLLSAATYSRNTVWQDEIKLMEDVVRKSPLNAKVRNGLGHAYMTKGRVDEAIEQFLNAVNLDSGYGRAYNSLGVAYAKKAMYGKALDAFASALRLEPGNPEIYNNIGVIHRTLGDTKREIIYFQAALQIDPNLAISHYNLGTAYEAQDWSDKAKEHFSRARALNPDRY